MTTSPNPNHAEEALRLVNATGPLADTDIVALAQVHATLALEAQTARLVDEQRTANLIAFGAAIAGWELELAYPGLDDQIAARLDLTQDVTP